MSDITHMIHTNGHDMNNDNMKLTNQWSSINDHLHTISQTVIELQAQLKDVIEQVETTFDQSFNEAITFESKVTEEIERLLIEIAALEHDRVEAETELAAVRESLTSAETNQNELNTRLSRDLDALASHTSKAARRAITAKKKKPITYDFVNSIKLSGVVIDNIFQFLPAADIACCTRVCRPWQQSIDRTNVWLLLMKRMLENYHRRRIARTNRQSENDDIDPDIDPLITTAQPVDMNDSDTPSPRSTPPPLPIPDLKFPYPDAPCVRHMHYCLTIVNEPAGIYSINISSRLVKTLYQCAAWSESFDGQKPVPPKKGDKNMMSVSCMLIPKADNGDLEFCIRISEFELQKSVALADIARLTQQRERDEAIKAGFDLEIADCNNEAAAIDNEVDTRAAQHTADEMTMSFLQENRNTLTEQLVEEKKQTESLRNILSAHRVKQETELTSREVDQERLEADFASLTQHRKQLLRERDMLKAELDAQEGQAEASTMKLKDIRNIISQLTSQLRSA